MFNKLIDFIRKFKWPIVIFWVLLAAVIVWQAPKLSDVAKTDSQSFFPENTEAVKFGKLLNELYPGKNSGSSLFVVFERQQGLNDSDRDYAVKLEKFLTDNKSKLDIKSISSPFSNKDLEAAMISKDKKGALLEVNLTSPGYKEQTNEIVKEIRSYIQEPEKAGLGITPPAIPSGLSANVTGEAAFGQEEIDNVNDSLGLTFMITILLVVLILIIIYRSPIAPILPLLTIGMSFLISRGLIAYLTTVGLKVSSFTEQFLVAVLFGAGTDYCLLLISRFREEIVSEKAPKEALKAAYPHTGKAIISSGGTVIIGFLCMVLATFGLYNTTGPSIAIGVTITILAVLTLTPALISIFGESIFWPAHPSKNIEKEKAGSPFWNKLAELVTRKPVRLILICLVAVLPFIVLTGSIRSNYDTLGELPKKSDAILGFDVIKKHFAQGEMMPVRVVLKSDKDLWSNESLKTVDDIAQSMLKVDGVTKVRTATRPLGDQINETNLQGQIKILSDGLGSLSTGLQPLMSNLNNLNAFKSGVNSGTEGFNMLTQKTEEISNGISAAGSGLGQLSSGQQSAINGLNSGLQGISSGAVQSKSGVDSVYKALQSVDTGLTNVLGQQPALANDPNFKTAYGTIKQLLKSLPDLSSSLGQISSGADSLKNNAGSGLSSIKQKLDELQSALNQLATGINAINDGQKKTQNDLAVLSTNLAQLSSGIPDTEKLASMESGIGESQKLTKGYTSDESGLNKVFYLPEGTLEKYPQLKSAMDEYISPNGKGVSFYAILSYSPYTTDALDTVDKIRDAVKFTLKGTSLENAEFYIGGPTSVFNELRDMTSKDFVKVMFFVLLGIFIVLVMLLRSLTAPLYLIITILMSFATTMGISYLVFQVLLGLEGLSWSVPFFSFCILVALGVDYNIFLMTRVKEEYVPGDVTGGTKRAVASTGKIITSCGIIMAGTFGAMLVSPVAMLVQIGFTAVVGLLLDTFIIRCILVPSIAVKVGEVNWWPGTKLKVIPVDKHDKTM